MQISRIQREDHPGVQPWAAIFGWLPDEEIPGPGFVDSRQRYLDAFLIPAAVIVLHGGEPVIAACNSAFGRAMAIKHVGTSDHRFPEIVRAFLTGEDHKDNFTWDQPSFGGRHFQVHLSRLPPLGIYTHRVMVSLVDRTAEIETARSLRSEMLHDSLTGLPNRLAFVEAIEVVMDAGAGPGDETSAILVIDLNRFSRINECIGPLAGDELIITVARRLVAALRDGDMLSRMGSNEFGVLLRSCGNVDDAFKAASRFQATLATPVRLSDLDIRVDCAIGCALPSDRVPTAGDLLRNAQLALKRAKTTGRFEIYQPDQMEAVRRRFNLETELRRAIDNDDLTLNFQPLVDLESHAVSGFEALARWTHPDHGEVNPNEFIAVAEECGLIVPLGRWALDAAVRTLAEWDRAAGRRLPIRLGVNVSPVQLQRDTIADALTDICRTRGVTADRLTLELTESSIVGDPDRAKRVLSALHEQGCRVAMDDFGTGYSSLASLQKLPIDILKIDRSFVTGMRVDRDAIAIIRAILSLAQTLGMSTTAEGIEDGETAQTLALLGCTTGQGYHFARPLAADAALAHLLQPSA